MGQPPEHESPQPGEAKIAELAGAYADALVAGDEIATEITIRVLALQREAQRVAESRRAHRVMLATPLGESHVVALRMVENLVRFAGYDVVMLGADVPASTIAAAVCHHKADVLCLSSTMPGRREELLQVIDETRRAWRSCSAAAASPSRTRCARRCSSAAACRRPASPSTVSSGEPA